MKMKKPMAMVILVLVVMVIYLVMEVGYFRFHQWGNGISSYVQDLQYHWSGKCLRLGDLYKIYVPKNWVETKGDPKSENTLSVKSPDGAITINSAAYHKKGTSLEEFVKSKAAEIRAKSSFLGSDTASWERIGRDDYRVIEQRFWGHKENKEFYMLFCMEKNDYLISLTLATNQKTFDDDERWKEIGRIMDSIEF
jgi:hypothetical protein